MTFAWAFLDEEGTDLGSSEEFDDRDAAEEWMGRCWQDLLDRGVEQVALLDRAADRRLYRMGLREN